MLCFQFVFAIWVIEIADSLSLSFFLNQPYVYEAILFFFFILSNTVDFSDQNNHRHILCIHISLICTSISLNVLHTMTYCNKQCFCDFPNDLILKKLNSFISQTCKFKEKDNESCNVYLLFLFLNVNHSIIFCH